MQGNGIFNTLVNIQKNKQQKCDNLVQVALHNFLPLAKTKSIFVGLNTIDPFYHLNHFFNNL